MTNFLLLKFQPLFFIFRNGKSLKLEIKSEAIITLLITVVFSSFYSYQIFRWATLGGNRAASEAQVS